ncbi:hypothetical protein M988_0761 [Hafnia paralvei ATCC 29927]|uniref:Uncharacterized protein n=1 Tax=Hafnia alvei ATCC 51873 TaxID=1002364 RepID=G9Y9T8_HAFAL|nr:hypothetical protein F652_2530 [Enterobacteriaceae bacterium bta3-1]EHM40520.1 hypothetical protein HMPREF0454_03358 [Hafnia alvei ATCC 51873]OAT43891.1 hypothetical protein M988_0761 [Hafnia paralvei ATCC 29927]
MEMGQSGQYSDVMAFGLWISLRWRHASVREEFTTVLASCINAVVRLG